MLRRAKDDKDPTASDEPIDEGEALPDASADPLDERLAPLEEFRGKTDQWMKETSAQLARVATHVQQDEKRQEKLDSRLAEFEDRIQAMLTLTEALSAGENPFVRKQGEPAPPSAQDPEPKAFAASPPAPQRPTDGRSHPSWAKEEEGEPAPTQLVHAGPDVEPAPDPETTPVSEEKDDPRPEPLPAEAPPEPRDAPPFVGAGPSPATDLPDPFRGHPNDPSFDSYVPDDGSVPPGLVDGATARPLDETPRLDTAAAREAEGRLVLLQWARLLARQMRRIDIEAFLETYVDTGWVSNEQVVKVRALAADLARHAGPPVEQLDREDLHVRTILILSNLPTRHDETPRLHASNHPDAAGSTEHPVTRGG